MKPFAKLQKNMMWNDLTMLTWAFLQFCRDARQFWKNYTKRIALNPLLIDWDIVKHELIHL